MLPQQEIRSCLFSSYFDYILSFDQLDVPISGDINATTNIMAMLWTGLVLSNSNSKRIRHLNRSAGVLSAPCGGSVAERA